MYEMVITVNKRIELNWNEDHISDSTDINYAMIFTEERLGAILVVVDTVKHVSVASGITSFTKSNSYFK
jgi:hypothetical protein